MTSLPGQRVIVLGRDASGSAATALLRAGGAEVRQLDACSADAAEQEVRSFGPARVVVSAGLTTTPSWLGALAADGIPVVGERELAFEHGLCLHVAVTGGAGKSTTAQLIVHLLRAGGRRVELADATERPACGFVESSRDLDLLVHEVHPAELEYLPFFRPVVGVLLNLPVDPSDSVPGRDAGALRVSRLFARQQAFDWAIVQAEALAVLETVGGRPPGKVVTFSASERGADLGVERGLLVSRWEGWTGPLWDMDRGWLRGPRLAEDLLAALAVGRVLRVGLELMTPALDEFRAGPGRMEELGAADGVRFVDDGRASSVPALENALLALAPTPPSSPFVVLVAGGDEVNGVAYDLGPLLASRVRQVRLFGDAAPALQAAWNLFTPCSVEGSLLNAVHRATEEATAGEVVLFCPACPIRERPPGSPTTSGSFAEAARARLSLAPSGGPPGLAADLASGPPA